MSSEKDGILLDKTTMIGIVSIFIGIAFFLAVVLIYPLGNESSWGGMGILVISAIFGIGGLLLIIMKILFTLITHFKHRQH
ncbi:hypothetical protein [Alkalicoccobacillus plakortidis]|uniref:Uncharacterized protein n=1 Tax=Alkalicoccobacillus plakortidis TaxID=444060 RepID=A0ABT0XLM8_9BACI|nr:hypothetical protein [Alkalicoccobacillus plakortidis]MCM2676615.1 hypothetical protein [Alkalicoccobacillus plakortidis]